MRQKKLLYIINHLDWFWSHRLPLAQDAQNKNWDVFVAATDAQNNSALAEKGFKGLGLPPADQGFAPLTLCSIMWRIHTLLKQEKPELVHAITLKYAFLAGLPTRFQKDVKIIHTIAGLGYLFSGEGFKPALLRFFIGPFLKLALSHPRAHIIFQNPDDQALMVKRGFVKPERCTLIRGSGVDLDAFPFRQEPENDLPPLVLMPTRLVRDKGIAVFIEAARIVHTAGIMARFQIAGSITRNNPLALSETDMKALLENSPVTWLGKVTDMPALFQSCALVCYPSWYGEGVPKVLLEAAATGRAIVTTDHPGCREVVQDQENGFLVPVKDPEATAHALMILLQDAPRRKKMGHKSRARAEKEFDVKRVTEETLKLYQKT